MALQNPWLSPPNGVPTERSQRAEEIIQQIITTVKLNLTERNCFMGRNPDDMSPWGLFFAYRICAYHISRIGQGTCSPDLDKVAKSMRATFSTIDKRWNLAGICPRLHLSLPSCYEPDLICHQAFIFSYLKPRKR